MFEQFVSMDEELKQFVEPYQGEDLSASIGEEWKVVPMEQDDEGVYFV